MFIELVDRLRCLAPHADSWLVASAERMGGRDVLEGALGCPVCRARYEVRGGVALFGGELPAGLAGSGAVAAPAGEEVERAAALLGLAEPGGFVLLEGEWAALARPLVTLAGVHAVVLNPVAAVASGDGVSVVIAPPGALPLAEGTLRGAALGGGGGASLGERAVRALRGRGRLVGPAAAPPPDGARELARDARHWVAERGDLASAPVPLGLARRAR